MGNAKENGDWFRQIANYEHNERNIKRVWTTRLVRESMNQTDVIMTKLQQQRVDDDFNPSITL